MCISAIVSMSHFRQKTHALNVVFVEQHLATVVNVIIYAEFKFYSFTGAAIFLSIYYLCY